jgi:hypothetical protein
MMDNDRRMEIRALATAHAEDEGSYVAVAAAVAEAESITDDRELDYLVREVRRAQRIAARSTPDPG